MKKKRIPSQLFHWTDKGLLNNYILHVRACSKVAGTSCFSLCNVLWSRKYLFLLFWIILQILIYTYDFFSLSVLAVLWVLFFFGAYKISQFEKDFTEYDPYAVLELDRVSYLLKVYYYFIPINEFNLNIYCNENKRVHVCCH